MKTLAFTLFLLTCCSLPAPIVINPYRFAAVAPPSGGGVSPSFIDFQNGAEFVNAIRTVQFQSQEGFYNGNSTVSYQTSQEFVNKKSGASFQTTHGFQN